MTHGERHLRIDQLDRRGFTLIELLVVIAIISLLVAITVPALGRIKEQARLINCKSQLADLTRAMIGYSNDNRDRLPSGPIQSMLDASPWPTDPDLGCPYELYDRTRIGNTALRSQNGWYGLGLLWKRGFIEQGQKFYCPTAQDKGLLGYNQAWPRRFNSARDPIDDKIRVASSYAYRGGLLSQAGTPNGPLEISGNSSSAGVLADNPCAGAMWHSKGYNVSYLDGRVEFCQMDKSPVPRGKLQDFWPIVEKAAQ